MYGSAEHKVLEAHQENGHEVAMERSTKIAREDRERGPYVVRDLSWDLAKYLNSEGFSASTYATSTNASES